MKNIITKFYNFINESYNIPSLNKDEVINFFKEYESNYRGKKPKYVFKRKIGGIVFEISKEKGYTGSFFIGSTDKSSDLEAFKTDEFWENFENEFPFMEMTYKTEFENKDKIYLPVYKVENKIEDFFKNNNINYKIIRAKTGSVYFDTDKGKIRVSDHTGNFRDYNDVINYFFNDKYGKNEIEDRLKNIFNISSNNFINEASSRYYTGYDKDDDILPKEIFNILKSKLGIKRFTRLGSGKFGTAFKISNTKVLKITKDLKEYEYAKKIEGLKNNHIADVYKTYHFNYNNDQYAIIIKEFCKTDEYYFDNIIDNFLEYTGGEMSLSYLSSEYLHGDINKKTLDDFFKKYKDNGGPAIGWMFQWYNMLLELKSKKIYVKDFNGANIGTKPNGELCIIELGLGYWDKIKFIDTDKIEVS